ncbi:hypothetical protein Bca101_006244 [Brassica carinata]
MISLEGFARVVKHRCLRHSGQFAASTISPVSSSGCFGSFVLCLCDGTRIEPLKPPLPSANTPPIIHLLVSHCRLRILRVRFGFFLILHVWSGLHRYDGWTRTCRPCFTCLPLRFALGTVRGPSNCSLVVFSNGSSDFDAGTIALSIDLVT